MRSFPEHLVPDGLLCRLTSHPKMIRLTGSPCCDCMAFDLDALAKLHCRCLPSATVAMMSLRQQRLGRTSFRTSVKCSLTSNGSWRCLGSPPRIVAIWLTCQILCGSKIPNKFSGPLHTKQAVHRAAWVQEPADASTTAPELKAYCFIVSVLLRTSFT